MIKIIFQGNYFSNSIIRLSAAAAFFVSPSTRYARANLRHPIMSFGSDFSRSARRPTIERIKVSRSSIDISFALLISSCVIFGALVFRDLFEFFAIEFKRGVKSVIFRFPAVAASISRS